jgi:uncharacterized membrane protein YgcG
MTLWLAVILVCGVILIGMVGTLWILARGSNVKRRWTLVGLLLNEELNAPGESASTSAKERREAKKLLREQQSHLPSKSHAQHSQHHGGNWGTGHHGSSGVSHHGGGFESGGGFHGGSGHHG